MWVLKNKGLVCKVMKLNTKNLGGLRDFSADKNWIFQKIVFFTQPTLSFSFKRETYNRYSYAAGVDLIYYAINKKIVNKLATS